MSRSKKYPGIYPQESGTYQVDAHYKKQRIRGSGFKSVREAQEYLESTRNRIRLETDHGTRRPVLFDEAAARYIEEQVERGRVSWKKDISMLRPLLSYIGQKGLHEINDALLRPFIQDRLDAGLKGKTVNSSLALVRVICNRASSEWFFENGMTWLEKSPRITLIPENDKRPPRPISWAEQKRLVALMPEHLANMVIFSLNTGVRENVICNLQWEWEARVDLGQPHPVSVFVVPRSHVKGRRSERIIVCNSVAQEVVDKQRGLHPSFVFTYPRPVAGGFIEHQGVEYINNTAWGTARKLANLDDVRVHDLRHTVGMRLRNAGVSERTQNAILWHSSREMSEHYAVAQLREIYQAVETLAEEREADETIDLHALIRSTQIKETTKKLPSFVEKKKGLKRFIA